VAFERARAEHPGDTLSELHAIVALKLHLSPDTVRKHIKHPDASPDAKHRRTSLGRAHGRIWTGELIEEAIRTYWDLHDRKPTRLDWSPQKLRRLKTAKAQQRLADWHEPWTDSNGVVRRYPRADTFAFRAFVDRVAAERTTRKQNRLP
jgi:hypothetical protein